MPTVTDLQYYYESSYQLYFLFWTVFSKILCKTLLSLFKYYFLNKFSKFLICRVATFYALTFYTEQNLKAPMLNLFLHGWLTRRLKHFCYSARAVLFAARFSS